MSKTLSCIALACAVPAFAHAPDPARGVAFDQHVGAQLPLDLAFTDDMGRSVTLGQALEATPALLVLGYPDCQDLCPLTLSGVGEALRASGLQGGVDYRGLFVSIDPRVRPGDLAREKAQRIGGGERGAWRFLEGSATSVGALAQAVGFRYRQEEPRDAFAHPAGFVVVTPQGRISRYFFGVRYDPGALSLAVHDAADGRSGGLADRLLLLCYHFDPLTGRYTVGILNVLRGVIAVFLLAAAAWGWRQFRHRRRRP